MTDRKIDDLYEKYKHLFHENFQEIWCDDGWYNIIDCALNLVNQKCHDLGKVIQITQIKEKFGGLRIYFRSDNASDEVLAYIRGVIYMAEFMSMHTCEITGNVGKLASDGCVMKTLSEEKMKELNFKESKKYNFTF